MITEWTSLTKTNSKTIASADDAGVVLKYRPTLGFLINGLSWPATERLTLSLGETFDGASSTSARSATRCTCTASTYEVDSLGDGLRDTVDRRPAAASRDAAACGSGAHHGADVDAERAGNWLFHCHVDAHVVARRRLTESSGSARRAPCAATMRSIGMAGMVLGVTIVDRHRSRRPEAHGTRHCAAAADAHDAGRAEAFRRRAGVRVRVDAKASRRRARVSIPGPTLVLQRGEPVEITLVNRLPEATAIHWHGMELDSYYDGVHGWSGADRGSRRSSSPAARSSCASRRRAPARSSITRTCTTIGSCRRGCMARCSSSIPIPRRDVRSGDRSRVRDRPRRSPAADAAPAGAQRRSRATVVVEGRRAAIACG